MNELEYLKKLREDLNKRIKELEGEIPVKNQKIKIKELFTRRYTDKTKEISSVAAKLPWSGKEGKLLRDDLEIHGYEALVKYIEIFFSDKDQSIADFTRYKMKAGYSFSVFHGMIAKLSMSKVKPKKVCKYCGKSVGHEFNCPVTIQREKEKQKELDEINMFKDQNKDVSFSDMFLNNVRRAK